MTIKHFLLKFYVLIALSLIVGGCSQKPDRDKKQTLRVQISSPVTFTRDYSSSDWVKDFRNFTCPNVGSTFAIKDGNNVVIGQTTPIQGNPEIVGTKPIQLECFYSLTAEVPEVEQYSISELGINTSFSSLISSNWSYKKVTDKAVITHSVLT